MDCLNVAREEETMICRTPRAWDNGHFMLPPHSTVTQRQVRESVVVERAVAYLATRYLVSQSVVFAGASGKCEAMKRRGPDAPSGIPPI